MNNKRVVAETQTDSSNTVVARPQSFTFLLPYGILAGQSAASTIGTCSLPFVTLLANKSACGVLSPRPCKALMEIQEDVQLSADS